MEKKGFFKRYQYQLYFIVLYILYIVRYLPTIPELDVYNAANWFVGYEFGFISRGLIGAVMNICFNYIEQYALFIVIFAVLSIMYFLAVHLICKVIHKTDEPVKFVVVFLAFLYTVSPAGLAYLFQAINFGRFDMFLIIITFILIILIYKFDNFYLVPLLCIIAICIHQVFIFLYFPAVFMLMIYKYISSQKKSRAQLITIVLTAIITCAVFLMVQLNGKIDNASLHQVELVMGKKTNVYIFSMPIELEYFTPIWIHQKNMPHYPLHYRLIGLAGVGVFLSPLMYLLGRIWKNAIRNAKENKTIYLFMSVGCVLATIPVYILAIDWGRWFAGTIMMQFVLIFALTHIKDKGMTASLNNMFEHMKKNYGLYIFIFVLTASIGYFVAADFIPLQQDILDIIESFK